MPLDGVAELPPSSSALHYGAGDSQLWFVMICDDFSILKRRTSKYFQMARWDSKESMTLKPMVQFTETLVFLCSGPSYGRPEDADVGPNTYGDYSSQVSKALPMLRWSSWSLKYCEYVDSMLESGPTVPLCPTVHFQIFQVKRNYIRPGIKMKPRFETFEVLGGWWISEWVQKIVSLRLPSWQPFLSFCRSYDSFGGILSHKNGEEIRMKLIV